MNERRRLAWGRRLPVAAWLSLVNCWAAAAAGNLDSYETTRKLPELHHAVGISLPADWGDPLGLPLAPERKLECRTCHGLPNMERRPYAQIDTRLPDFLRGGPYRKLEDFCYRCHDRDDYIRPNIHVMRNPDGSLREDHCTFCHEEVHRERRQPLRRVDYKLRLPPEKLCYGCHLKTPHFNALEHQSAKPEKALLQHLRESQERLGVILPLSAEGRVMCPTCHNPHQYGVIEGLANPAARQVNHDSPAEGIRYREHPWNKVIQADKRQRLAQLAETTGVPQELEYRRIEREVLLRLPAKDGTLCQACHEFDE